MARLAVFLFLSIMLLQVTPQQGSKVAPFNEVWSRLHLWFTDVDGTRGQRKDNQINKKEIENLPDVQRVYFLKGSPADSSVFMGCFFNNWDINKDHVWSRPDRLQLFKKADRNGNQIVTLTELEQFVTDSYNEVVKRYRYAMWDQGVKALYRYHYDNYRC